MTSREPLITALGQSNTPERAHTDRHAAEAAHDGVPATPLDLEPGDVHVHGVRQQDVRSRRREEPRCSPDPFVATDRYRLTMPYDDGI